MSAALIRRTTGSILPETDVIGVLPNLFRELVQASMAAC
jgi:hypothetical protein